MNDLASLPNKHGFEFIGIMKDGTELECWVYKEVVGTYVVLSEHSNRRVFDELKGWKHENSTTTV